MRLIPADKSDPTQGTNLVGPIDEADLPVAIALEVRQFPQRLLQCLPDASLLQRLAQQLDRRVLGQGAGFEQFHRGIQKLDAQADFANSLQGEGLVSGAASCN